METLNEFKNRTSYIYDRLDLNQDMSTNPNLSLKVDHDGSFKPFYGDTVVFLLHDQVKDQLKDRQNILYERCFDSHNH